MNKHTLPHQFSYNNREFDWLRFNERVLQEAEDQRNPLYERLRFLAIFSSNLDEFFRVRVSKIRQIKRINKNVRRPLGLKPNKLLKHILHAINEQQERFGNIFHDQLVPELGRHGIRLIGIDDYSTELKKELRSYFEKHLKNQLNTLDGTQIKTDSLDEGKLYLAAFDSTKDDIRFVMVPTQTNERFIPLSAVDSPFGYTFLEDVLKLNIGEIFPDMNVSNVFNIKLSKDAELYLEDEYEGDWVEQIYESLQQRKAGQPTRLLYERAMDEVFQERLRELLNLGKVDMVMGGERHNFSDFLDFPNPLASNVIEFDSMPPLKHPAFEEADSIFDLVEKADQLLHFPYQDFEYLEHWLTEAADDPLVKTIHISLYRIAKESKLTSALLKALANDKKVHIFVEAKARFDEKNNILWGRKFEENGAKVYYSFPNVKVHSKILLIQRQHGDALKKFAYIGTGNFNAKTAKIYCDHALFTSDAKITHDLEQVFKVLKRELLLPKLKRLLISPYNLRTVFEQLIQREMDLAEKGFPAKITAKMNSLEDRRMIDCLYRASNAGVKIQLIVRGFCCLVPGITGQSENITVISIVDRFLEHARLFLFHNNGDEEMFMGSADWMTRNLDKRIEVVTPIRSNEVFRELKTILNIQLADNQKARHIDAEARNAYVTKKVGAEPIRSQYAIYEYLKSKE
jgi:polyphosphate kinase